MKNSFMRKSNQWITYFCTKNEKFPCYGAEYDVLKTTIPFLYCLMPLHNIQLDYGIRMQDIRSFLHIVNNTSSSTTINKIYGMQNSMNITLHQIQLKMLYNSVVYSSLPRYKTRCSYFFSNSLQNVCDQDVMGSILALIFLDKKIEFKCKSYNDAFFAVKMKKF